MNKNKVILYIVTITISISIFGIIKYSDKINLYEINTFEINGNKFLQKNEIKTIVQKSVRNLSYNFILKVSKHLL